MAERTARRSARVERHEIGDEVGNLQDAVSSLWGEAFQVGRFSDFLIDWNEKTAAHLRATRTLATAANALAQRQGKLMFEFARSIEMDAPADGRACASMKLRSDKVDHVFDETAEILREANQLVSEAQVNALNFFKPPATAKGKPRLVASIGGTEAA